MHSLSQCKELNIAVVDLALHYLSVAGLGSGNQVVLMTGWEDLILSRLSAQRLTGGDRNNKFFPVLSSASAFASTIQVSPVRISFSELLSAARERTEDNLQAGVGITSQSSSAVTVLLPVSPPRRRLQSL